MTKNLSVRAETMNDREQIFQLHRAAFGEDSPGKLVDDLRAAQDAVISLVAAQDNIIIGHVMLSRIMAPIPALSLAPVGVHPDYQKQAIGSILITAAIEKAKQANEAVVFVLGSPEYYQRFGFNVAAALPFTSPYNGPDFMALMLRQDITPGGDIKYPAAFDQDIIDYAARTQRHHEH